LPSRSFFFFFFWHCAYILPQPTVVPFLIMGRVTYIHHYLPTLWFAVLMAGHVMDQLVFAERRRFTPMTKNVVFGISAFIVVGTFWWFRAMSFGIEGPVGDHSGWQWRKVRWFVQFSFVASNQSDVCLSTPSLRTGTSIRRRCSQPACVL